MKRRTYVPSPTYRAKQAQLHKTRPRSNVRWVMTLALCCSVLICLIGLANTTVASNNSMIQTAKEQILHKLITAGNASMEAKIDNASQALIVHPAPVRQAGITTMHQGPFLTSLFTVRSLWQGPVGGTWILAYSGAKLQSNGTVYRGGLVLYTEIVNAKGGFDLYPVGTFLTPKGTTALTITAAHETLLDVSSESGTNLTFDLITHQFY